MNRYFFRLPHSMEYYYSPAILVVTPSLEYYWERRGAQHTNGRASGTLSSGDEQTLISSDTYIELRPDADRSFILNGGPLVRSHTATHWREALAPYVVATSAFPKRPGPRLKTNHKIGAPKGKLP